MVDELRQALFDESFLFRWSRPKCLCSPIVDAPFLLSNHVGPSPRHEPLLIGGRFVIRCLWCCRYSSHFKVKQNFGTQRWGNCLVEPNWANAAYSDLLFSVCLGLGRIFDWHQAPSVSALSFVSPISSDVAESMVSIPAALSLFSRPISSVDFFGSYTGQSKE